MAPLSTLMLASEPSICAKGIGNATDSTQLFICHHKPHDTCATCELQAGEEGRVKYSEFLGSVSLRLLLLQHVAADINSQHVIGDHLHTIMPRTFVCHDSRYASQQAHLIKLVVVWFYIFLSVTPSMRQSSYNPATAPHTANAVSANTHNVEQRIIFWSFNSDKNIKCHNTYLSVTILECIFLWN